MKLTKMHEVLELKNFSQFHTTAEFWQSKHHATVTNEQFWRINSHSFNNVSSRFSETSKSNKNLVLINNIVVIGKPERHMRKASHCGSKQQ